jgi:polyisoprenoid-binding protein YceI
VRTLLTGNDHRDRDLRASMEAGRFPMMRFDLSGVTFVTSSVARLDSAALMLHGALSIHGVTRNVDLPALVRRSADTTHITARFPLLLADYEIGGLTKMLGLLRMQNQIEVRVDLIFVDTPTLWANP